MCANHQKTGFKVLAQWYYTPERIHKVFPQSSDLCWRCGGEPGFLLHIFWSCRLLVPCWNEVHHIVQRFTDRELPLTPVFFLLHHHEILSKIYRRSILPLLLTAAKSYIPLFWKQTQLPGVAVWLKRIAEINEMEDLVATDRGLREKFLKKWFYWHEFTYSEEHAELMI